MSVGDGSYRASGAPLCWYHYHRRFKTIAAVPYEEWMMGMEVLVEEVGVDG